MKRYPDTLEWWRGKRMDYAMSSVSNNNRIMRMFIIHRDNYTCRICGFKGNFDNLVVHHVKYQEIFDPDLLITLCNSCHRKIHRSS